MPPERVSCLARSEGDIKRNRANVIMVGLVVVSLLSIMYEVTAMPVGPKLSDGSFLEYKDYIDQVGNDTLQFTVNFTALSVRGEDVWARAVFVGAGLGWAFDDWLGTRPWGMIILFFLGTAAGMLNVWRSVAGMGQGVGYGAKSAAAVKDGDGEDEDRRGD